MDRPEYNIFISLYFDKYQMCSNSCYFFKQISDACDIVTFD